MLRNLHLSTTDTINVVVPLFNDWEALNLLLERFRATVEPSLLDRLSFLVVNDCSSKEHDCLPCDVGNSLLILHLYRNVGHQKAIAIGLSYLADQPETYPTIVMDADGEDKPQDIVRLIQAHNLNPRNIVFAQRTKRHESWLFKLFYVFYKQAFRLLTGKVIAFGNFSLIPPNLLQKIAHVSEIWNNYPGGVIRSRLPYSSIPLERGVRLAGESKMNFVSLILHGLSTVSVLIDTTAVRIALFCVIVALGSVIGIGVIFLLSFFTHTDTSLFLSEWETYTVFSLILMISQAFLISLLLVFIVLMYRTQPQVIPAFHYRHFVERREVIHQKKSKTGALAERP